MNHVEWPLRVLDASEGMSTLASEYAKTAARWAGGEVAQLMADEGFRRGLLRWLRARSRRAAAVAVAGGAVSSMMLSTSSSSSSRALPLLRSSNTTA